MPFPSACRTAASGLRWRFCVFPPSAAQGGSARTRQWALARGSYMRRRTRVPSLALDRLLRFVLRQSAAGGRPWRAVGMREYARFSKRAISPRAEHQGCNGCERQGDSRAQQEAVGLLECVKPGDDPPTGCATGDGTAHVRTTRSTSARSPQATAKDPVFLTSRPVWDVGWKRGRSLIFRKRKCWNHNVPDGTRKLLIFSTT